MTAFRWIEGVGGEVLADGKRLEAVAHGPPPGDAPTIVMLHEGLGCVALWRDFPAKLAAATGWGVFAYSRAGYGRSDPVALPRPLDYMAREARLSLPAVLDAIGMKRGILLGHSDGASIATIYAGEAFAERVEGLVLVAPHVFTEEPGLASISEARGAYETGDLRARLSKYHTHVDTAFRGWNDAWLHPDFRAWNIEHAVRRWRVACACGPGRRRPLWNAQADPRDRGRLARAGEKPHPRRLPPFAAHRAAASDPRGDRGFLRRRARVVIAWRAGQKISATIPMRGERPAPSRRSRPRLSPRRHTFATICPFTLL